MNRVLVVSFVGWICAVAFALAGIGLFITKALVGQFEGSWWWVIGCGIFEKITGGGVRKTNSGIRTNGGTNNK